MNGCASGPRNKTEFTHLRKWAHCDMSAGQSQGEGLGGNLRRAGTSGLGRLLERGVMYRGWVNEDTSKALVWWQTYLQLTPYVGHQSTKLVFHVGRPSTQ